MSKTQQPPNENESISAPVAAQEPVAWRARGYGQYKTGQPGPWGYHTGAERPKLNDPSCCDVEPLYALQAAPAEAPIQAQNTQADLTCAGPTKLDKTALLPCPFCGAAADGFNPDGDMEGYSITCSGKGALFGADESCCPICSFSFETYGEAVAAWNNRAALAKDDSLLRQALTDEQLEQAIEKASGKYKVGPNYDYEDVWAICREVERASLEGTKP